MSSNQNPSMSGVSNLSAQIDPVTGEITFTSGATTVLSILPNCTWANRPAAASSTGKIVHITDIGPAQGSDWVSDGAYWKPRNGYVLLAQSGVAIADPNDTNENVLVTYTIPAGLMPPNARLQTMTSWTLVTGGSANVKTARLRLGGAGGTQFMSNAWSTSTTSARALIEIYNRAATNSQVGATNGGGGFGTTNSALITGTIDLSAASSLVISAQKDAAAVAASETFTLEAYEIALYVP